MVLTELCLLSALCGLGYFSLGGDAATAAAIEEGLLEQKRDDDGAVLPSNFREAEMRNRGNVINET
jgi:hypothetical protein